MRRRYQGSATFDRRRLSPSKIRAWRRNFEMQLFFGPRATVAETSRTAVLSEWITTNAVEPKPLTRETLERAWQQMARMR